MSASRKVYLCVNYQEFQGLKALEARLELDRDARGVRWDDHAWLEDSARILAIDQAELLAQALLAYPDGLDICVVCDGPVLGARFRSQRPPWSW